MTVDTLDNLGLAIGRKLTNREWVMIITENFKVSNSLAKDMYHAMLYVKKIKGEDNGNKYKVEGEE